VERLSLPGVCRQGEVAAVARDEPHPWHLDRVAAAGQRVAVLGLGESVVDVAVLHQRERRGERGGGGSRSAASAPVGSMTATTATLSATIVARART
jgi:hypothetical protein